MTVHTPPAVALPNHVFIQNWGLWKPGLRTVSLPSMDASPVVSEIHNPCNSEGRLPINDSAGGGGLKDGHNGLEKTHFNWES